MANENTGLLAGPDGISRCFWHGNLPDYLHYHDHEWGRPVADDRRLFEKICLEGFQSGLSWLTILRKRENFREAFAGFEFDKVAAFTDEDVERLLGNAGIIRHRGKIVSTINNANRAREMADEFGSLAAMVLEVRTRPGRAARNRRPRASARQSDDGGFGPDFEGIEKARLELRRPDHRLRLHAGDGPGQRPSRRLRLPQGGRGGAEEIQAAELSSSQVPLAPVRNRPATIAASAAKAG